LASLSQQAGTIPLNDTDVTRNAHPNIVPSTLTIEANIGDKAPWIVPPCGTVGRNRGVLNTGVNTHDLIR
jgi:hypothetical protein